jgi:hypothetical protein
VPQGQVRWLLIALVVLVGVGVGFGLLTGFDFGSR